MMVSDQELVELTNTLNKMLRWLECPHSEDVAQIILLRAWKGPGLEQSRAYWYKAVQNATIDERRLEAKRKKRTAPLLTEYNDPEDAPLILGTAPSMLAQFVRAFFSPKDLKWLLAYYGPKTTAATVQERLRAHRLVVKARRGLTLAR